VSENSGYDQVALENGVFPTRIPPKYAARKRYEMKDPHVIRALIPGIIAEVHVKPGAPVRQGETLLILEAMKMLNRIMAPFNGVVKSVGVEPGGKVVKGQVLIELHRE